MRTAWMRFFALCLALAVSAAAQGKPAMVKRLEVAVADGRTRLVVSLDGTSPYRMFTLSAPDRVVLDGNAAQLVFYSNIPGHMHPFHYLYAGIDGHNKLVPLMWLSSILAVVALAILVFPHLRRNENILAFACVALFSSLWIDKGFGLIIGGFVPNMFEGITEYWPTLLETLITLGVWAIRLPSAYGPL